MKRPAEQALLASATTTEAAAEPRTEAPDTVGTETKEQLDSLVRQAWDLAGSLLPS